jgi:predicted dehydrogenase
MRFLICGLGSIGRRHLRNLQALGEADIVLLRSGRSTLPDAELEGMPVERDLEAALERWKPDAVIVANPTALHVQVALPAARAGCHLLLEKPVSHTMEGLDELQQALAERARQALVGFQFRFHPMLARMKEILEGGQIGGVISARAVWGEYLPDWHPWEDYRLSYSARRDLGGGVVLTLCHPLDYLRWLLGEVAEVTAEVWNSGVLGIQAEDNADILLRTAAGARLSLHLDYNQRPPAHWVEVVGSQGYLRWDYHGRELRWRRAEEREWHVERDPPGFERNHMFLDEMRHFLRVVKGAEAPRCSLQDGIRALQIALAAHEAASSGCRVSLSQGEAMRPQEGEDA